MKLTRFKVTNYRNVLDSGWVEISEITAFVGQNEAGKSNLFDALYRINPFVPDEAYNIDEDWRRLSRKLSRSRVGCHADSLSCSRYTRLSFSAFSTTWSTGVQSFASRDHRLGFCARAAS